MDDEIADLLKLPTPSQRFHNFEDLLDRITLANYSATGYSTYSDWRRHREHRSRFRLFCAQTTLDKDGQKEHCSWQAHALQADGRWTLRSLPGDCKDHSHGPTQPPRPPYHARIRKLAAGLNIDFWSNSSYAPCSTYCGVTSDS